MRNGILLKSRVSEICINQIKSTLTKELVYVMPTELSSIDMRAWLDFFRSVLKGDSCSFVIISQKNCRAVKVLAHQNLICDFEFRLKCRIVLYQAVSQRKIRTFPILKRFISLHFRLKNVRRNDGYNQLELHGKFQRVLQCVNFIFVTAILCLKKKILIKGGDP